MVLNKMQDVIAGTGVLVSSSGAAFSFIAQATTVLQMIAVAVAIFAGIASGMYYITKRKQLREASYALDNDYSGV